MKFSTKEPVEKRSSTDTDGVRIGPDPISPAPVLAVPKRRRRTWLIAVGVLLTVLGMVITYVTVQGSSDRVAVVGLAKDVAWGQPLTAADLVKVEIVDAPALSPVLWSDRGSLVGQLAATDLLRGGLLTPTSVTGESIPGPGMVMVGVSLAEAQLPATPLLARDQVRLIFTKGDAGSASPAGTAVAAEVLTVGIPDASGARTVDVLVKDADSAEVAVRATAGELVIVVVPQR